LKIDNADRCRISESTEWTLPVPPGIGRIGPIAGSIVIKDVVNGALTPPPYI